MSEIVVRAPRVERPKTHRRVTQSDGSGRVYLMLICYDDESRRGFALLLRNPWSVNPRDVTMAVSWGITGVRPNGRIDLDGSWSDALHGLDWLEHKLREWVLIHSCFMETGHWCDRESASANTPLPQSVAEISRSNNPCRASCAARCQCPCRWA